MRDHIADQATTKGPKMRFFHFKIINYFYKIDNSFLLYFLDINFLDRRNN